MVGGTVSQEPVVVTHERGSYPVYVQAGALARLPEVVQELLPGRRLVMITDANVGELYRSGRLGGVPWTGETLTFEPGEKSKSRESWARLTDAMLERGFGRNTGVIAMGGGVAGDLAGFVAATYMRGVPYLQVPTTLLAMLDASVGGKTGVDTSQGKNLVGAFHQPVAVIADPQTLTTLPDREYRAGLSEAVKHGLIADQRYFAWMEANVAALTARDLTALAWLIRRSVEIKGEVVAGDEREAGRRAVLNAGHTVAHALEKASDYQLPHGEAVAAGLIVECDLAERLGAAQPGLGKRVAALLAGLGVLERLPRSPGASVLLDSMASDKKNRDGHIHFALPAGVGEMHRANGWTTAVPIPTIRAALAMLQ